MENVCIMTKVGIYSEHYPEPSGKPLGSALGISIVLRLYFTVYASSRHNTDTILGKLKSVYSQVKYKVIFLLSSKDWGNAKISQNTLL